MRAFFDILGFELRLHARSPLFWGVALLFFLLHLLTITQTGINLGDNKQIDFNSAWLIFQTDLVLGAFGMLPAIIFVVTAITRDHERNTAELFFTTPVPKSAWILGRFSAGTLAAILVGFAGLAGSVTGTLMPWLDQSRIGPFTWQPFLVSFSTLVLPNLLVCSALFFTVAALTRSTALTFGAALGLLVLDVVVYGNAVRPLSQWLLLADPFGLLPVEEANRYWTVSELNTNLPTALLLPNRLFWLGLAALALLFTGWRYRMELSPASPSRKRLRGAAVNEGPHTHAIVVAPDFGFGATLRQLRSQLHMDMRAVLQSPLFWLVLLLGIAGISSEVSNVTSGVGTPPAHRVTSLFLGYFRVGLMQFVLLLIIYYSAVLVHLERGCGVDGMSGCAPCPDWIPVVSKTLVLCGLVSLLLLASMLTSMALQVLAGYYNFEIGLYLQGLFIYNGFYFYMLCVLAILVQVFSPGKWSGMVLMFCVLVGLITMPVLGFEHLLYGFRIPYVVYSDMNGWGHSQLPVYALIAYWSAFCVLLLVLGHLLFPRGYYASIRERIRDARSRITAPVVRISAVAGAAFAALGAFIFWNTNIVNDYLTRDDALALQARFELDYGQYKDRPAPSLQDIDLHVDLYPEEHKLESHGSAVLINNRQQALREFVVSLDVRMRINSLVIEGATQTLRDTTLGFHLFTLDTPLQPGATLTMRWNLSRENRSFVNGVADTELVANGTFVESYDIMPMPGYDIENELTDSNERERAGLPPAARLPALGDFSFLDDLRRGVDLRGKVRTVVSTTADQTAVTSGVLLRHWEENDRRYFEYATEVKSWPIAPIFSARYEVARAEWNGVALEVFHDPKHPWNPGIMLDTASKALAYYSREFAPYPLSHFRIVEFARYRNLARAFIGAVAYSETAGFLTDHTEEDPLDFATLHELAHQWWGGMAYGAYMQGRQILNEGLAQYATMMMYKEYADPVWLREILRLLNDGYLNARSSENVAEQPVYKTEDQGYISYNKAPLALFAMQDLIGKERMHQALRAYLAKFGMKGPPYPTSLDLINEIRAVAGPEYQTLITDLFEKIMLYDVSIVSASAKPVDGVYEVTLEVSARQFEADGSGVETEVPLNTWFDVVVFPESDQDLLEQTPLYKLKHRLQSGTQLLILRVPERPGAVGVDSYHLMIDRVPADNLHFLVIPG